MNRSLSISLLASLASAAGVNAAITGTTGGVLQIGAPASCIPGSLSPANA